MSDVYNLAYVTSIIVRHFDIFEVKASKVDVPILVLIGRFVLEEIEQVRKEVTRLVVSEDCLEIVQDKYPIRVTIFFTGGIRPHKSKLEEEKAGYVRIEVRDYKNVKHVLDFDMFILDLVKDEVPNFDWCRKIVRILIGQIGHTLFSPIEIGYSTTSGHFVEYPHILPHYLTNVLYEREHLRKKLSQLLRIDEKKVDVLAEEVYNTALAPIYRLFTPDFFDKVPLIRMFRRYVIESVKLVPASLISTKIEVL